MTVNSAKFSRRRWRSVYRLVGFSSGEVRKSRPSAATGNSSFCFTSRHPRLGNCEKVLWQETRAYTSQPIWPVGRGKKREYTEEEFESQILRFRPYDFPFFSFIFRSQIGHFAESSRTWIVRLARVPAVFHWCCLLNRRTRIEEFTLIASSINIPWVSSRFAMSFRGFSCLD